MEISKEEPAEATRQFPLPSTAGNVRFSSSSIQELLDALPECSSSEISEQWLPAVRTKLEGLKTLLQDSVDKKEAFHREFPDVEKLINLVSDLRKIADNYNSTFKSAEALAQHELDDLVNGVRIYERKYREEHAKVEAAQQMIQERDEAINDLNATLKEIVRVLATFIQNNIHGPPPEEVKQIIADYTPISTGEDEDGPIAHVRLPESSYKTLLHNYADVKANLEEFRDLMASQDEMIKDQNDMLVKKTQKYEACLRALKAKKEQITALGESYVSLQTKVFRYQSAVEDLRDRGAVQAGEDGLQKYISTLEVQVEALAKGIANRDSQIESLLSQVRKRGGAMSKLRATEAATGTENTRICSPPSSSTRPGANSFTPMRSNSTSALLKGKSSSTATTPGPQASTGTSALPYHRRSASAAGLGHSQVSHRPRSDSLGALQKFGRATIQGLYPRFGNHAPALAAASSSNSNTGPMSSAAATTENPGRGLGHAPASVHALGARRYELHRQMRSAMASSSGACGLLGDIPEAEAEAAAREKRESPEATSTTSSDREIYRNSISALNALSMSHASSMTSVANRVRPTNGEEADDFSSSGSSELLTVSQMYHEHLMP